MVIQRLKNIAALDLGGFVGAFKSYRKYLEQKGKKALKHLNAHTNKEKLQELL